MKLVWNVLALLGLAAGVVFGVSASSAADSGQSSAAAVHELPSSCTVIRTSTSNSDLWSRIETCGPCTVVVYPGASARDEAINVLSGGLPSDASWAAIGNYWIATTAPTTGTALGAEDCAARLGGYIAHLS